MYIIIITCPRKAEKDHCFTTRRGATGKHSRGVGSTGGAEGCRVPLLLATKSPGCGEMHSRVGKYSFHGDITEKKLCDNYSALRYRLNNLSS